jgi:hypothetical protein
MRYPQPRAARRLETIDAQYRIMTVANEWKIA